jgi:hypothetical protein
MSVNLVDFTLLSMSETLTFANHLLSLKHLFAKHHLHGVIQSFELLIMVQGA